MNTHADRSQHVSQKASDTKQVSRNSLSNPLMANLQSGNPLAPQEYEGNPLQLKSDMGNPLREGGQQAVQSKLNNTGLPDNLKSGVENLSGYSMDDVKVHYNSDKPAQLQAFAYAQGSDIHLGPSQEKHLPHEAWHVVQQKQGRVQSTLQTKSGILVNDDKGLESEADRMGNASMKNNNSVNTQKFNGIPKPQLVVQKTGFNDLPSGPLGQIMSYLPLQDRLNLRETSIATRYQAHPTYVNDRLEMINQNYNKILKKKNSKSKYHGLGKLKKINQDLGNTSPDIRMPGGNDFRTEDIERNDSSITARMQTLRENEPVATTYSKKGKWDNS